MLELKHTQQLKNCSMLGTGGLKVATCKDCLHVEVCKDYAINYLNTNSRTPMKALEEEVGDYPCCRFKDRYHFIELPHIGDYDIVTIFNDIIDHCYKIAVNTDENICAERKAEYMRLCGWIGDLKRRIITEQMLKEHKEND